MKILMTKFANKRNDQYRLSTTIYEESDRVYVSKSAISEKALSHLNSLRMKHQQLENYIVNPALKVNKILKELDSSFIFEYIKGKPFEKLVYRALSRGDTLALTKLLMEFCEILKTSFKVKPYDKICDEIPDGLKEIYKKDSLGYFCSGIPFDLTPGNIFIKDLNGTYEIIDYEWTVSFPLPLEFIIYRALHCCALQYNSEVFQHNVDISQFAGGMTFNEFFQIETLIMSELQPYKKEKHEPILPDIQLKNAEQSEYSLILFSQLYLDYGNGYSEKESMMNNLGDPLSINEIIFSFKNTEKRNIKEIRFDPLNIPCALKVNQISFCVENKEIFTYNNRFSNGINDAEGVFYFSSSDPQFFLKDIPSDVLNKFDTLKISLEFISFGKSFMESFGSIAKNIYESLQHQIIINRNSLAEIQSKLADNLKVIQQKEAEELLLQNSLTDSLNIIQKNEADKLLLQKKLSNAQLTINTQKQQLDSLEKQVNVKHIEIVALQLKNKDLSSNIELADRNNKQLLNSLNEKNSLIEDLNKEIKKFKNKMIAIRESKEQLNEDYISKLKSKEMLINQQLKDLEALRQGIRNIEDRILELEQNNNILDNMLIERDVIILKYRKSIHEYRKSRSWRMTAPYRALDAAIAKLAGGKKHG